jgi:hypothetical protein
MTLVTFGIGKSSLWTGESMAALGERVEAAELAEYLDVK